MNRSDVSDAATPAAPSEQTGVVHPSVPTSSDERTIEDATTCNNDTRLNESYLSNITNILSSSLKWCPTSEQELQQAEYDLLSVLKRPFRTYFVDIGAGWGFDSNRIRTLEMMHKGSGRDLSDRIVNEKVQLDQEGCNKQPLVLIHGFASGIGNWILNLDSLSTNLDRKVFAFDLIGFARSSRAPFDLTGDVEAQFIDSIERWRERMGFKKFILLGHSFGGYLSACYALKHPNRVSQVILADPWGIQDRQASERGTYRLPFWVRAVNSVFQHFNPLAVLRFTGPYGPNLVHKFRGDLREKFRPILQDDCNKFLNYIYHSNAQTATGESAFKSLALPYGWPKNPLIHRLLDLNSSVSMTFIYGQRSWIEKAPGEFLRDCMTPGRVTVNIIQGSGHHVYADKYEEFNNFVKEACSKVSE